MKNIKKGDWVRCIGEDNDGAITFGGHYKVFEADGPSIRVINNSGTKKWYNESRFELITNNTMKFTTPVAMRVTKEQYFELAAKLTALGYIEAPYNFSPSGLICTSENLFGWGEEFWKDLGREFINPYNPELFLALAAMTDVPEGMMGEYWICTESLISGDVGSVIKANGTIYSGKWRKCIKEELISRFSKKEFVLPEKWAVKRTPENYKVINEWGNKQLKKPGVAGLSYHDGIVGFDNGRLDLLGNFGKYTEITYEQFLQHVLKQPQSNNWVEKGDVAVCIKTPYKQILTVGKQYKILEVDGRLAQVQADNGIIQWVNRENFKPLKQPSMEKKFKVGSKARYKGTSGNEFTKDNLYETISFDKYHIEVRNDLGAVRQVYISYFEPVEERKQIGWKLVKPEYNNIALSIAGLSHWGGNPTFHCACASIAEERLIKAGVLELWFEPIYEAEKPQNVTLTIGSQGDLITVKRGSKSVSWNGNEDYTNIDTVDELHSLFTGKQTAATNKLKHPIDIFIPEDLRVIRIGCSAECHMFSPNDLKKVISAWDELNK